MEILNQNQNPAENKKFLNTKTLKKLFLGSQSLTPTLINFTIMMEIGSLIILTNPSVSNFLKIDLGFYNINLLIMSKYYMLVELLLIIAIQLRFDASFFRLCYLKYFYDLNFQQYINYTVIVLAVVALVIDFLKTANWLVIYKNQWSQKFNSMKLLSFGINIIVVVTTKYNNVIAVGIICSLFLINYGFRMRFRMVNDETQLLLQVMCVLGFSLSVYNLIQLLRQQPLYFYWQPILLTSFVIVHLLLKKFIFKSKISKCLLEIEKLLENGIFLETIGNICSQLYSFNFRFLSSCNLKIFLESSTGSQLTELNQQSKQSYLKLAYQILVEHQDKFKDNSLYWIMRGEMEIQMNNNIFGFVRIVEQLQIKAKKAKYDCMIRIMIVRLKQLETNLIDNLNQNNKKDQAVQNVINGFEMNYRLVEQTSKAASQYCSFWEGFVNGYISVSILDQTLDHLIQRNADVEESYQLAKKYKSKSATELYLSYLNLVKNDQQQCKKLKLDLECLKSHAVDIFPYQNTMYFSNDLSGNILRVGQNSAGLLNYQRGELEGKNLSKLIPKFCQLDHVRWFEELLQNTVNHKGIENLVRFNKETFCVDAHSHLKIVKLDLSLHLLNQEIVFSGSLQVSNLKRMIAFKGSGEIVLLGDYNGDCEMKYIFEDNNLNVDEIIRQLTKNETVKINLFVDDNSITDEYTLFKVIIKEDPEENVYVVKGLENCFHQRTMSIRKPSVISKNDPKPQKYFIELQKTKTEYLRDNTGCKTLGKVVLLVILMVFVLLFTIKIITVNIGKNESKREVVDYLSTFQTNSLGIVNIIGRTFHIDYSLRQEITYPAFDVVQIPDLLELIEFAQKSFQSISQLPELVVSQQIETDQFDAISFQVIQTLVTNFDWMLMDLLYYAPGKRFIELVSYTAKNSETFLFHLLPFYQEKLLERAFYNALVYRQKFLLQISLIPIVIFFQFVLLLVCNCHFKNRSLDVSLSVLALENQDVTPWIRKIESYRNLLESKKAYNVTLDSKNEEMLRSNSSFLSASKYPLNEISVLESNSSFRRKSDLFCRSNSQLSSGSNSMMEFIIGNNANKLKPLEVDEVEYQTPKKGRIRTREPLKRNYVMYSIFGAITIAIMINFGLYFQFTQKPWYSLKPYIQSAIALKATFYSYEVMFTTLLLNFNQNNSKLQLLEQAIRNFTLASQELKKYEPSLFNFQGFEEFRQLKDNLDYQPICNYMECRLYYQQFNVTYYASLQYSYQKIEVIYQALSSRNLSYRQIATGNYDMDYLVYADQLYMQIINKTLNSSFREILTHIDNNQSQANLRILIHLGFILLLGVVCFQQSWEIIGTRRRAIRVLDLFKQKEE